MKSLGPSIDKATAYCSYCPKLCRFSCPAAAAENRETVTPWGMMRLLELVKKGAVEPSEDIAEIFYHCMGCLRCQKSCKHDNDVPEAMWEARAWMREEGQVPELLEGFVDFFLEENSPHTISDDLTDVDGPRVWDVFDPTAEIVFMPDCETRHHYPEMVTRTGKLLEMVLGEKVRLQTRDESDGYGCCGFPILSAGDRAGYQAYREKLNIEFAGVDYVVTDCAAMVSLYSEDGSFGYDSDVEVVHLIELLAEHASALDVTDPIDGDSMMAFDSCFVGRHLELYDEFRTVLAEICDPVPAEFDQNREHAPCCGGPSHYHVVAPAASEECASQILEQMDREGGEVIACGSATCKKAFRRAGDDGSAHDILELVCQAVGI